MCSRTGLGLFVGYLSVICYGLVTIACIVLLVNDEALDSAKKNAAKKNTELDRTSVIIGLVVSSLMTLISGLLVSGILKRRHRYMKPWLVLAAISIAICLVMALIGVFRDGNNSRRIIISFLGIGIQCIIFFPIYSLYKEFHNENVHVIRQY